MDYWVSYQHYYGSLLTTQILSSSQTILLGDFGPMTKGATLTDTSGTIYVGEETVIDGRSYIMLGSGTAQPGADAGGLTVGLSSKHDILLLESKDTQEKAFVFPDGEPSFTGEVSLVVDIQAKGYDFGIQDPICFAAGTFIQTARGYLPVETLQAGDTVLDINGDEHTVRWISARHIKLPCHGGDHLRPVLIKKNSLGPGEPFTDTRVSMQHRILLRSTRAVALFGANEVFVSAKSLINDVDIIVDYECETVEYYHILCERHTALNANGMPAESLLPVQEMLDKLPDSARIELEETCPDIFSILEEGVSCHPILKNFEARLLGRNMGIMH